MRWCSHLRRSGSLAPGEVRGRDFTGLCSAGTRLTAGDEADRSASAGSTRNLAAPLRRRPTTRRVQAWGAAWAQRKGVGSPGWRALAPPHVQSEYDRHSRLTLTRGPVNISELIEHLKRLPSDGAAVVRDRGDERWHEVADVFVDGDRVILSSRPQSTFAPSSRSRSAKGPGRSRT